MQGLLIDPGERTVTPVDLTGIDGDRIRSLIGCDGFAAAYLPTGDAIYVDDEGLEKGPTNFFLIEGMPQPLAGKGLLVGSNEAGADIAPSVTREWVVENIDFGQPMRIGPMIMFMGERTRREIRG